VAKAVVTRDAFIWLFKAMPVLPSLCGFEEFSQASFTDDGAKLGRCLGVSHAWQHRFRLITQNCVAPYLGAQSFPTLTGLASGGGNTGRVASTLARLRSDLHICVAESAEAAVHLINTKS
jgi:hypothetical protein